MISPNQLADPDGRYTGPDYSIHTSKTGNFYSTFSLWDTYRAVHPLYTLIIPEKNGDMCNSMVEHAEQNGYLPMWTLWGTENHCMIANHSISVIAEAFVNGIGGFDYKKAYEAMKVSTTKDHKQSPWQYGNYDKLGYFANSVEHESISKTLESAYNDWCVAQLAKKYGTNEEYNYYVKRAGFYKNLFHPQHLLIWSKDAKGAWRTDFDPAKAAWWSEVTEGNSWQYTWSVQHDVKGLMALFPSKEKFIEKLDSTFNEKNVPHADVHDVTGLIGQYAHGNEPSHHITYLYNYAGQPCKTQTLLKKIIETQYNNTPDGLCGNEDCGQMSAWYVFNAMGIYPVNPVGGTYDFGTPTLKKAEIEVAEGRKFTIVAKNISDKNFYIQTIKLNGKVYDKLFITHEEMRKGGLLEFEMGNTPDKTSKFILPN